MVKAESFHKKYLYLDIRIFFKYMCVCKAGFLASSYNQRLFQYLI